MSIEQKMQELKTRLAEAYDLEMVNALLNWDQSTYMPAGSAAARARQSALMARLSQETFTDPAIGNLLDELQPYAESLPYDSDEASLIRVTRRKYEHEIKLPPAFVGKLTSHMAETYQVWAQARPENNFAAVQPYLEKTLDLSREMANFFPGYEHIADPLIDYVDEGMRVSTLRSLFAVLRQQLVPIVQAITAQPLADDSCLRQHYPKGEQLAFGAEVVRRLGYDFNHGRIDETHHPFTTKFSLGDVRITTRFTESFLSDCLFSVIHEAGHAIYEQGIRMDFEGTPLAGGTSSGVHESQSRLWENRIGRSRSFWEFFYPRLQEAFPNQLGATSLETFYRAVNKVERSLIRTEADEVTYNLHVMLRFDFELALLEGKLAVRDLPEAWHERFKSDIGVSPPDDRDGVLQDVHWYGGWIGGAFQGYTLGNILGAQFFNAALKAYPEIPAEIRQGKFETLLGWLTKNIYQHGHKFTASELVERVTGGPINLQPYINYLQTKYGELYKL
jgi:carboxypeptidase Taq